MGSDSNNDSGKNGNDTAASAAPWGIGERMRALPEAYPSRAWCGIKDAARVEYHFQMMKKVATNNDNNNWMENVSYTPTLTYDEPWMVRFYSQSNL